MALEPMTLISVMAIYLLAGLVKGAMGFGLPLVAIALLPLVIPVDMALSLNAIVIVVTNLQQIIQGGRYREGIAAGWPVILGFALAIPPVALIAAELSPQTLLLIVGIAVLGFIAASVRNPALEIPHGERQRFGFLFGIFGGCLGALTSAPAAIVAPYVLALHLPRPVYMTMLGMVLSSFGLFLGLAFAWVSIFQVSYVGPGLISVPIAILGMWIGDRWARKLATETFRRAVMILLGVIAIVLIRRGFG
ncbi:MAG: sulfite exporter TauE/SafE family protein [Pseudomonadota bacterium]